MLGLANHFTVKNQFELARFLVVANDCGSHLISAFWFVDLME
jgi:hypothetical protein